MLDDDQSEAALAPASGDVHPRLTVSVICKDGGRLTLRKPSRLSNARNSRYATTFSVPETGCPIQTIVVSKGASEVREDQTGWGDDIEIVKDVGAT